jgi:hypothetical protein
LAPPGSATVRRKCADRPPAHAPTPLWTSRCHYRGAPRPRPHRSRFLEPAAWPTPRPRHSHCPALPAAKSPDIPGLPPVPTASASARRKPGETGSWETGRPGSRSVRTLRACAPASRSHAGNQCDASPGRAVSAPSLAALARTTPGSSRAPRVLPPIPPSVATAPSRCCSARGSCSPGRPSPAAAPDSPTAGQATDVAGALLP